MSTTSSAQAKSATPTSQPAPERSPTEVIPLSEPVLGGNEWRYVRECLDSGWISTAGAFVTRFEDAVAKTVGRKHAVAMATGTSALHVGLLALGVQPDDEVIVSTLTFIASANAVRYVGAWPTFIDAESKYWQIDANLIEDFLTHDCVVRDGHLHNKATGRRVAAIMPVSILGHPVEIDEILNLAKKFNLPVIEDAAESLGARFQGQPVGASGEIGCLSFNGNKTITAAAGGMLLTDDDHLAARARHLSTTAKHDPTEHIHNEVGFNYRMSSVHAAIGCAQLEQLSERVEAKRRIAAFYARELGQLDGVQVFTESPDAYCTYWLSALQLHPGLTMTRHDLQTQLAAQNIHTRPLWQPLHLSPAMQGCHGKINGTAEALQRDALCLPSTPNLSDEQLARVVGAIRGYVTNHNPQR